MHVETMDLLEAVNDENAGHNAAGNGAVPVNDVPADGANAGNNAAGIGVGAQESG